LDHIYFISKQIIQKEITRETSTPTEIVLKVNCDKNPVESLHAVNQMLQHPSEGAFEPDCIALLLWLQGIRKTEILIYLKHRLGI
jgi:hypothetical protein